MNGEWERDQTKFLLSIIREGTQIQTEQIRDRFFNLVRSKDAVTFPIPYVEYPCLSEKENQRLHVVKQSFLQAIKEIDTLDEVALTICLDENINQSYDKYFHIHLACLDESIYIDLLHNKRAYRPLSKDQDIIILDLNNRHKNAIAFIHNIHFFLSTHSVKMMILFFHDKKQYFFIKTDKYDEITCIDSLQDAIEEVIHEKKRSKRLYSKKIIEMKTLLNILNRWKERAISYGVIYNI